jgi:fatty-acyl-CoA synthase
MEAPLDALMMDFPLTLTHFFERSRRLFGGKMLATRIPGQPLFRYTYADFAARTMRLGNVLGDLGLRRGDRVATLAWNSHRHLELYWAVPLSGYVLHTLNLRLSTQDLAYIVNHAGDRVIFADASLLPILAGLRDRIPTVTRIVVMPDTPDFSLPPGPMTTKRSWRPPARSPPGLRSRNRGRRRCATRRGRPAIPRVSCTRTVPSFCTAWPWP